MKQNPHITPEGYFSDLKSRLHNIPDVQEMPSAWQRVKPHLAMAAAFLAIVTAGTAILRNTAGNPALSTTDVYSQYELAQLVRTPSPYLYDEDTYEEEVSEPTEEELIEYLISTGVTIENFEADENEN
ncbi:MAG: hypothetical protein IJ151_04805 [Bacteroidales bacterium]|nr:hypothetical protein [Bacteroidales bacterium]